MGFSHLTYLGNGGRAQKHSSYRVATGYCPNHSFYVMVELQFRFA